MTDKELIKKIKTLNKIEPDKDWVILSKQRILGEEYRKEKMTWNEFFRILNLFINHKLVFSSLTLIVILFGVFGFAQNSVPGDLLYPVKKTAEQTQKVFVDEKSLNVKIVNNRLEDLEKVAKNNSVKNLPVAINEYQASVSKIASVIVKDEIKSNPEEIKKIVKDVKSIENKEKEIKSLGIEIEENIDLDSALVELIKAQVNELEQKKLLPEQIKALEQIKSDISNGNFSDALEKILLINQDLNNQENQENQNQENTKN